MAKKFFNKPTLFKTEVNIMPFFPRSRAGKEKEGTHFLSVPSQTILSPDLSRAIDLARQEMDDAYLHFQNASDPDLIDCYIYQGNAAWKHYQFLLRQAKAETTAGS